MPICWKIHFFTDHPPYIVCVCVGGGGGFKDSNAPFPLYVEIQSSYALKNSTTYILD